MIAFSVWAVLLGLVGFAAVEFRGQTLGMLTALSRFVVLDALAYTLATLLLALLLRRWWRRARGIGWMLSIVVFVLLFAPLAALLGAVGDLTLGGDWGVPGLVRSGLINTPLNLIFTLTVELGFVALPLGLLSAGWLSILARRTP
jgi:hypothetical protein